MVFFEHGELDDSIVQEVFRRAAAGEEVPVHMFDNRRSPGVDTVDVEVVGNWAEPFCTSLVDCKWSGMVDDNSPWSVVE